MRYKSTFALFFLGLCACFLSLTLTAQNTQLTKFANLVLPNHNIGLTNPLWRNTSSTMTYDAARVAELGGAFELQFVQENPSETGFQGYPSGTVGGYKAAGNNYHVGKTAASGMPVRLGDLQNDLRIQWKTSQEFAFDDGDKWWASINVIFDNGPRAAEPDPEKRDFDVVIEFKRYEQEEFSDKANNQNGQYWWFARKNSGSLKTFPVWLDGEQFDFAVRYKFFEYPSGDPREHKNDKVHVKFIAVDNDNVPSHLDHPLKSFTDAAVEYLDYTTLSSAERNLALLKMDDQLWIKSVSAGYEVYTGEMTLRQDYFRTEIDNVPPGLVRDLSTEEFPNRTVVKWKNPIGESLEAYAVYRSVNGGAPELLDNRVRQSRFVDRDLVAGATYSYSVAAIDRSFNEGDITTAALPVTWVSFRALLEGNTAVTLTWQTTDEKDNAGFTVERSVNAINWDELQFVAPSPAGSISGNYRVLDKFPPSTIAYYRIRQTDYDGTVSYSSVQSVEAGSATATKLEAFPVPAQGMLHVRTGSTTQSLPLLYDAMGRKVSQPLASSRGLSQWTFDVSSLPAGTYFMRLGDEVRRVSVSR